MTQKKLTRKKNKGEPFSECIEIYLSAHTAKGTSEQQEALERSTSWRPSYRVCVLSTEVCVCVSEPDAATTARSPQSYAQPQAPNKSR